jgi:hypothetical protein
VQVFWADDMSVQLTSTLCTINVNRFASEKVFPKNLLICILLRGLVFCPQIYCFGDLLRGLVLPSKILNLEKLTKQKIVSCA